MAFIVNTNIENQTEGGYLLDAKNVKGSYVVVTSTEERNSLPIGTVVKGTLCYVTGTEETPIAKFYQYTGAEWVEALTVTSITTAQINALWADTSEEPEDTSAE